MDFLFFFQEKYLCLQLSISERYRYRYRAQSVCRHVDATVSYFNFTFLFVLLSGNARETL